MIFKRFRKKKKTEIPPPRIIYKEPVNVETLFAKVAIDRYAYDLMTKELSEECMENRIRKALVNELANQLQAQILLNREYDVERCCIIFSSYIRIVKENEYE